MTLDSSVSQSLSALANKIKGFVVGQIGSHNSSSTAHSDIRNSIPTTTSQLTNNSGFLTSHQDISGKANISHTHSSNDITNLFDAIYPVGAIYMSVNNTSPSTLFGGTWQQLTDTFLYASTTADDDVTTAPSGQGEATHTLTINEMPSHSHRVMDWTIIVSTNGNTGNKTMGSGKVYHPAKDDRDVRYSYGAGGGAAHNNMPPYMKVYMWKRTA